MIAKAKPKRQEPADLNLTGDAKNPEIGHVRISDRIVYRRTDSIFPSPENDELYAPIDTSAPEFRALAAQIRVNGITDAIITTKDGYVISGHRRLAAAKLIGLEKVPTRRANIRRSDPRFLVLLRDCNRQRVKSLDQVLREEIISTNPDDSYIALVEHRIQAAKIKVATGTIVGVKRRARISDAKQMFLDAIRDILERLHDYWPLSDRLIHYQLLNDPPLIHSGKPDTYHDKNGKLHLNRYCNHQQCYKSLTEILTRARIAGVIPFEAIHDPTRPVTVWNVHPSPGPFIRAELDRFLLNYWRDLQVSQPCHLEILGEKNTIEGIIRPVAMEYTIPFTLGRGYSSLPPRHAMAQRFRATGKERLVIIVLGDHDPEGEDIAHSFARSMRDDFGIVGIDFIKAALTADQVTAMNLPLGLKAKKKSSRRKKFVELHGEHVHELEAVEPAQLQRILRRAIEGVMDMNLYRAEQRTEHEDSRYLAGVRKAIHDMLAQARLDW